MYSTAGASGPSLRRPRILASNFAGTLVAASAPGGTVSVPIDSIGIAWRTGANSSRRLPPTRCVGESAAASAG